MHTIFNNAAQMTDEQINAAITEAIDADPHWKCAKDYCADLNAMHEAEKVLNGLDKWRYALRLTEVTQSQSSDDMSFFCATARQRAEAFLRTLGKWKEGE
jgi:hypothetical protein